MVQKQVDVLMHGHSKTHGATPASVCLKKRHTGTCVALHLHTVCPASVARAWRWRRHWDDLGGIEVNVVVVVHSKRFLLAQATEKKSKGEKKN